MAYPPKIDTERAARYRDLLPEGLSRADRNRALAAIQAGEDRRARQRAAAEGAKSRPRRAYLPASSGDQLLLGLLAHVPVSLTGHGLRRVHVAPRVGGRTLAGEFWSGRHPVPFLLLGQAGNPGGQGQSLGAAVRPQGHRRRPSPGRSGRRSGPARWRRPAAPTRCLRGRGRRKDPGCGRSGDRPARTCRCPGAGTTRPGRCQARWPCRETAAGRAAARWPGPAARGGRGGGPGTPACRRRGHVSA